MRRLMILLVLLCLLTACGKRAETPSPAAGNTAAPPAAAAPASKAAPATSSTAASLTSLSAGAIVVTKPQEGGYGWWSYWLLDERPDSGWRTPENVVTPQTLVVSLPEKTQLDRLEFDTANTDEGTAAKDVLVEVSDTSATEGFQPVATLSLAPNADKQSFPVAAAVAGRWMRVTVKNNHGSPQYTELMDVRGYGKQLTQTPLQNVSGTYDTSNGGTHLQQDGASVSGCYESNAGLLNGGVEGRVLKFTWSADGGGRGNGFLVFTPDAKELFGLWWNEGETNTPGSVWYGTKTSSEVGSCPNWSGKTGAEDQMRSDLATHGRARIYGINFDTDSDAIKPESRTTLNTIVDLMKKQADWKLKIEGHTDSIGGAAHNDELSQRRAEAVKKYLVGAGIDAARLSTAGLGMTQPVADNGTELGRAQNRRVELAKE